MELSKGKWNKEAQEGNEKLQTLDDMGKQREKKSVSV